MFNKLLQRQIQKHFGTTEIPESFLSLLKVISDSYDHYEKDRNMLERSIDLSSKEMIELNTNLRKETDAVKKAHHELKNLLWNISEVFFSIDMRGFRLIQISAACEKVYGYTQAEFMNNTNLLKEVVLAEDKKNIKGNFKKLSQGESIMNQYRIYHKNKGIRWVEIKIIPTFDTEGNIVRIDGVTGDITEHKEAEIKLHSNEELYRNIVETAQEGIWIVNEEYRTIFVNNKLCEILGYHSEDMIGKLNTDFSNDEGKLIVKQAQERTKQGIRENFDVSFIKKNGNHIWVNLSTSPLLDKSGNYTGALAMVTDITERKRNEYETLELVERLQLKNKELRQFAYILSHNVRAPIARIMGLASLFKADPNDKIMEETLLDNVVKETNHLDNVVRDLSLLITSGHSKKEKEEYVDFESEFKMIEQVMAPEIKQSKALITTDFHESTGVITIRSYLYSIMYNLISNSIKYRLHDEPLHIHVQTTQDNKFVCFSVKDNGTGIDLNKNGEKIFGLYKRFHKQPVSGKGIGLILVKTQIESLGGKVDVESKINEGALFKVFFPKFHEQ